MAQLEFMNRVTLVGIVGKTKTVKINDKTHLNMSMVTEACMRDNTGNTCIETTWHNIEAFQNKDSDPLENIKRGDTVRVTGRIRMIEILQKGQEPKQTIIIYAYKVQKLDSQNYNLSYETI